jgi:hypothetical protein
VFTIYSFFISIYIYIYIYIYMCVCVCVFVCVLLLFPWPCIPLLRNNFYLSGFITAVPVFRKPNTIPPLFSIDLVLNFLLSWLLVLLLSTFFLDVELGSTGEKKKRDNFYAVKIFPWNLVRRTSNRSHYGFFALILLFVSLVSTWRPCKM